MAAPAGNQNAAKGTMWRDALRMELARDKQRIRRLVAALLDKAEHGDVTALKEIGDRLDGKPIQAIAGTGEDGQIIVEVIRFAAGSSRAWTGAFGCAMDHEGLYFPTLIAVPA